MKTAIKTTSKAQRVSKKNSSKTGCAADRCALSGLPSEVQQAWADDLAFAGEQGFELGTFDDYMHDMLIELRC